MTGAVPLVLTGGDPASRRVAVELFAGAERRRLTRAELRPPAPFTGPLFALLASQPAGGCIGLVVPVFWRPPLGTALTPRPASLDLLAVADHVNLELRGPLTGRWPAGAPRTFPPLTGVYQPAVVRALGGPRVYSSGVVVAGVADAGRLTPFEVGALVRAGITAVSDVLVPAAIVAAYYGLTMAACGVPQADEYDEE